MRNCSKNQLTGVTCLEAGSQSWSIASFMRHIVLLPQPTSPLCSLELSRPVIFNMPLSWHCRAINERSNQKVSVGVVVQICNVSVFPTGMWNLQLKKYLALYLSQISAQVSGNVGSKSPTFSVGSPPSAANAISAHSSSLLDDPSPPPLTCSQLFSLHYSKDNCQLPPFIYYQNNTTQLTRLLWLRGALLESRFDTSNKFCNLQAFGISTPASLWITELAFKS